MWVKLFVLFSIIVVVPAWSQLDISGLVQIKGTNTPVAGASVKIYRLNRTTTTDANGKFSFSETSTLEHPGLSVTDKFLINPSSILYRHNSPEAASIRIMDLSGKLHGTIFNGNLQKGTYRVTLPKLSAGIYLCVFQSQSEGLRSIRFLTQKTFMNPTAGSLQLISENKGRENTVPQLSKQTIIADIPVDTLFVTKSGYHSATYYLSSYHQNNLNISLEDSSATNNDNATIIPDPSWTCYMPEGIPPPQSGTSVFKITLQYSALYDVGTTQFGYRRVFVIKEGSISGNRINGTILNGGLDFELTLTNGSMEIEQINIIRTNNNSPILMRNAGVAPAGDKAARMVLDFEAPNSSSYTWLHTGKFAANRVVDTSAKTITLDVYDISQATLPQQKIQIKDPSNVPNQTWECFKMTGTNGATVFTENVSLGSSIAIGASKRGSRNIIPITGGTTTGRVTGKILNAGADYQLSGLDARYVLAPNDGEIIIVRNCGSGQLIPVFEARADGSYAFLNENKYLSSPPNMGAGGVSITFYEKR